MIALRSDDWVVCFWIVEFRVGHWMSLLYRPGGHGPYKIMAGLRLYLDDKIGVESQDFQDVFETYIEEEQLREAITMNDRAAKRFSAETGGEIERIEVNGPLAAFEERVGTRSYAHLTHIGAKA